MYSLCIVLLCINFVHNSLAVYIPPNNFAKKADTPSNTTVTTVQNDISESSDLSCSCGVFMTKQFIKGSSKPPTGSPVIRADPEDIVPCGPLGVKKCTTKCLESIVQHLSAGPGVICGITERDDIFRERAFLFVKHCNSEWINTLMSAGREYCCKNHEFYPCPNTST